MLEQVTREVNVEALPNDDPRVDRARRLDDGRSTTPCSLGAVTAPQGVTLLDDLEETADRDARPPRARGRVEDEIESETEVVGEGAARRGRGAPTARRRAGGEGSGAE